MKIETTYQPPLGTAVTATSVSAVTEASSIKEVTQAVAGTVVDETKTIKLEDFQQYMTDYSDLDAIAKVIKAKQEAIKEVVLSGLKEMKMKSVKTDYGTFSVVAESRGTKFDSKALKEESPRIYELFMKPSVTKSHLKVTPTKPKADKK